MTLEEFRTHGKNGPSGALLALWLDHHDAWEAAHEVAQATEGADGAWIHAYLHRKDKDLANAAYWYRRAGRPLCDTTSQQEWEAIATELLARVSLCSVAEAGWE
jgi:hypothetical protein